MANIKVGGYWFTDHGAYGELQWSTKHRGGCDAASWRIESTRRLPFKPGAIAEVFEAGVPVFAGTLLEPDGDTMHAKGLYYQGDSAYALDASGNPTVNPDAALFGGIITRGRLNWIQPVSLLNADFGTVSDPMRINDLLTGLADSQGKVIRVNGRREVTMTSPATTPKWHVTPGAGQLAVAEDSFVTDLRGKFTDSATGQIGWVGAQVTSRFGIREGFEDYTSAGTIDAATAQAIVNFRVVELSRPGWANSLRLASWELTTPGGAPANLRDVRGGDLIRIMGQMDITISTGLKPYVDVIADEVTYVDGSDFIDIKPLGYEPRDFVSVLAA